MTIPFLKPDRTLPLQDQLDIALSRIDDLENRSRRENFRIRGLPESITDTISVVQDFLKQIIPDIPSHKLEIDRAHRTLGPLRKDGLPRDIVVKLHYFSVKEEVMKKCRYQQPLMCRGHTIQVFADISPTTIQKRRSLKPLLTVLSQREIKYKWTFPFALKFDYKGKTHSFRCLQDGERLLLDLRLISQESAMDMTNLSAGPSKRPSPAGLGQAQIQALQRGQTSVTLRVKIFSQH